MYHVKCLRNDSVRFTRCYINGLLLLYYYYYYYYYDDDDDDDYYNEIGRCGDHMYVMR